MVIISIIKYIFHNHTLRKYSSSLSNNLIKKPVVYQTRLIVSRCLLVSKCRMWTKKISCWKFSCIEPIVVSVCIFECVMHVARVSTTTMSRRNRYVWWRREHEKTNLAHDDGDNSNKNYCRNEEMEREKREEKSDEKKVVRGPAPAECTLWMCAHSLCKVQCCRSTRVKLQVNSRM